jgi:hypothetical protein
MRKHRVLWFVNIDHAYYSVTFRGSGLGWRLVQLEGRRPGATYDVQVSLDGATACNCPDGASQRRPCKHAQALRALGGLSQPEEHSAG